MLTVSKSCTFDAAHLLAGHSGQCKNLHGHTYRVTVEVGSSPKTPGSPADMVIDFKDLKALMRERITDVFDHAFMYDESGAAESEVAAVLKKHGCKIVPLAFRTTSENLARHFFKLLAADIPVSSVTVCETSDNAATYTE